MRLFLPIIFAVILIRPSLINAQVESNIIMTEAIDNFVLVSDKSEKNIVAIKHSVTHRFMAVRAPGTAADYVFYNDFNKVNKAKVKAKGVRPLYQTALASGIFYDDSKICMVNVPLDEVNKPVETYFELTNSRPDLEPLIFLGGRYPINRGVLTITMPACFKDRFDILLDNVNNNIDVKRQFNTNGREWTITVSYRDMPALDSPKDAPPARYIYPTVQFIGQFKNTQELYSRLRKFTISPDPDSKSVKAKAIEITAHCKNDAERVRAIYDWVHENIRYIAIEHGDLGNTPDHASEVIRKRYGDCKGSANLIKGMLNAVGLDGRLVWIGTSSIPYDYTERPVISTGNHMIAALKLDNDSIIYLDGTAGMADYGLYSCSIQGKQTIVENGDSCIIGRVPIQSPCTNSDIISLKMEIDGNSLKGTISESLSGSYKTSLLNRLRDINQQERDKTLEKHITGNRSSWITDHITATNLKTGNGPAILQSGLKINRAVKIIGNRNYITLDPAPWLSSLIFDTRDRKYAGWLGMTNLIKTDITISLNPGMSISDIPSPIAVDNEWICGSISFSSTGSNSVEVHLTFSVKKILVPTESIESFNNDIKRLARAANIALVLTTPQ